MRYGEVQDGLRLILEDAPRILYLLVRSHRHSMCLLGPQNLSKRRAKVRILLILKHFLALKHQLTRLIRRWKARWPRNISSKKSKSCIPSSSSEKPGGIAIFLLNELTSKCVCDWVRPRKKNCRWAAFTTIMHTYLPTILSFVCWTGFSEYT